MFSDEFESDFWLIDRPVSFTWQAITAAFVGRWVSAEKWTFPADQFLNRCCFVLTCVWFHLLASTFLHLCVEGVAGSPSRPHTDVTDGCKPLNLSWANMLLLLLLTDGGNIGVIREIILSAFDTSRYCSCSYEVIWSVLKLCWYYVINCVFILILVLYLLARRLFLLFICCFEELLWQSRLSVCIACMHMLALFACIYDYFLLMSKSLQSSRVNDNWNCSTHLSSSAGTWPVPIIPVGPGPA